MWSPPPLLYPFLDPWRAASPGPAAADKPRDQPGAAGCSESLAWRATQPSRVTVTLLPCSFLFEALRGTVCTCSPMMGQLRDTRDP